MTESFKNPSQPDNFVPVQKRNEQSRRILREQLGDELFEKAHDLISEYRSDPSKQDDSELSLALKELSGKSRAVQ